MENNLELIDEALGVLEKVDFDALDDKCKDAYLQAHGYLMALSIKMEEETE